ncbi:hypothetical protein JCM6882_000710 [Rhodosporidiobolus microsporus]
MALTLPPDHPPIPTTSTSPFPTEPGPGCPMSALAATRPKAASPSPQVNGTSSHLSNGKAAEKDALPYAGQVFTLGTRNSKLAMVQTEIVRRELEQRWPGCEIRIFGMTTLGDNVQTQPLYTFGGKALWTKELEVCLLDGSVDAIVHSLKDVPTEFPPGCALGAVLEREDPSDALVVKEGLSYTSLEEMPQGSVIGTSSVRRVAQLRRKFPGLKFADVRGNLGTRLKKLDDPASSYTALILASAGLIRLNLGHRITASVSSPSLYHAVGQGAIGVEIRDDDPRAKEIIGSLECWKTSWRTRAERMMLRVLEGGCSVPVGCETKVTEVWVRGGEGDNGGGAQQHAGEDVLTVRSPRQHDDQPLLPISPRSRALGLSSPTPLRPVNLAATSPRSPPSGLSKSLATSPVGISAFHSAAGISPDVDETQGIPSGHPAVNPSAICPVTGRKLPSPPPQTLQHERQCTHRPGSPPRCPHMNGGAGTASPSHHATLELTGTITSLSGTHAVIATLRRRVHCVEDCEALGAEIAKELIEGGGDRILTELGRHVKEVGGGDAAHDGKPIPFAIPGGANTAPPPPSNGLALNGLPATNGHASPPSTNGHLPSLANGSQPIACPVVHTNGINGTVGSPKSPNSLGLGGLSKSPHSLGHRTVFREGEVCQRPAGW